MDGIRVFDGGGFTAEEEPVFNRFAQRLTHFNAGAHGVERVSP